MSEITILPFCANCLHARQMHLPTEGWTCASKQNTIMYTAPSLVTGKPRPWFSTCQDARDSQADTACGRRGVWFEDRDKYLKGYIRTKEELAVIPAIIKNRKITADDL